jgi:hypothetical protein
MFQQPIADPFTLLGVSNHYGYYVTAGPYLRGSRWTVANSFQAALQRDILCPSDQDALGIADADNSESAAVD